MGLRLRRLRVTTVVFTISVLYANGASAQESEYEALARKAPLTSMTQVLAAGRPVRVTLGKDATVSLDKSDPTVQLPPSLSPEVQTNRAPAATTAPSYFKLAQFSATAGNRYRISLSGLCKCFGWSGHKTVISPVIRVFTTGGEVLAESGPSKEEIPAGFHNPFRLLRSVTFEPPRSEDYFVLMAADNVGGFREIATLHAPLSTTASSTGGGVRVSQRYGLTIPIKVVSSPTGKLKLRVDQENLN